MVVCVLDFKGQASKKQSMPTGIVHVRTGIVKVVIGLRRAQCIVPKVKFEMRDIEKEFYIRTLHNGTFAQLLQGDQIT
jgi:hypothetical protein